MTSVLCLNVGSSSIKAAMFENDNELTRTEAKRGGSSSNVLDPILDELGNADAQVVAHRIVHGGPRHAGPAIIDGQVLDELRALVHLAPLHMPPALDVVESARERFRDAIQVACFDTAFHHSMPEVAKRYALPKEVTGDVVRRYGFHGLSCEYAVSQIGESRARRAVIAHLGSGCSVTAIRDGRSVDTSMGLTPTGGLVSATRPGDLDPGLMVYLLRKGYDAARLESLVNFESGLQALAGAHDMKALLARQEDDSEARVAVEVFCYHVAQQIGAYAITLGGIETLVFTGGIGEHASEIRERIAILLEPVAPFETLVVSADEERVMAVQALTMSARNHD